MVIQGLGCWALTHRPGVVIMWFIQGGEGRAQYSQLPHDIKTGDVSLYGKCDCTLVTL